MADKPNVAKPAKMSVENFTFERAKGATLKTETGIYSSRKSVTSEGKHVPLRCKLIGMMTMVTEIDKQKAREKLEKQGLDTSDESVEEAAEPGTYFRCDLTAPTIVVQSGQTKVQMDGEVLTFQNVQLERLRKYAEDPEFIHEWEIFPSGEKKVAGNKRDMHDYELTYIGKQTRAEWLKEKGDLLAAAAGRTRNRALKNGEQGEPTAEA